MDNILKELYQVILDRKENPQPQSYTCYLFEQGLDKMLKKVGEESAETIIAAKNGDAKNLVLEISDLLYHLLVVMAEENVPIEDVLLELAARSQKIGNLKQLHTTDKNS